ncbi:hypothetical protein CHUAL_009113 [Chamberlinius hualienensis]
MRNLQNNWLKHFVLLNLLFYTYAIERIRDCDRQDFGFGSVVCACNATFCDEIGELKRLPNDQYAVYTSSKDGLRFNLELFYFGENGTTEERIPTCRLERNTTFQTLFGFGGAFTDSAGININSLSAGAKDKLLRAYFSGSGVEYTFGRVPIGGADFSTRSYTYDDVQEDDFTLKYFRLAPEDFQDKISIIHDAQRVSSREIKLIATPWTAPAWMKEPEKVRKGGRGKLKGKPGGPYYQAWAKYIVRFFNEYERRNLTFWGMTAQNEPFFSKMATTAHIKSDSMEFTADTLRQFIAKDLGPAMWDHGYGNVRIMAFDDVLLFLPFYRDELLVNNEDEDFISGIAFHWYTNMFTHPKILDETRRFYPKKFLLSTEASEGAWTNLRDEKVKLGSWERGENYGHDIIQDLLHGVSGWVDWNLALDFNGGPNHAENWADSPIIVDPHSDIFYKQPMFYVIGHFSKFLPPDSVVLRLLCTCEDSQLDMLSASNTEKYTTIIILNRSNDIKRAILLDEDNRPIEAIIPPRSIQTYVWWHGLD